MKNLKSYLQESTITINSKRPNALLNMLSNSPKFKRLEYERDKSSITVTGKTSDIIDTLLDTGYTTAHIKKFWPEL